MKKLHGIFLLMILNLSCYLIDLEEYKHLENHDNDVFNLNVDNFSLDTKNYTVVVYVSIQAQFSIKRALYFNIFMENDTFEQAPLTYVPDGNGKMYPEGKHSFSTIFSYDPTICSKNMTLRVCAISDVDTIENILPVYNKLSFHCEYGGVDSFPVSFQFGSDTSFPPYIIPLQYTFLKGFNHLSNPLIITKFSKSFNKPYIMTNYEDVGIDSLYNFIQPENFDTLIKQNKPFFTDFHECNYSGTVDRKALCDIWMKRVSMFRDSIYELTIGKQYALSYPVFGYNDYLVFLLRINNIKYLNEFSGIVECTLFTFN